jgi:hypothetical protein
MQKSLKKQPTTGPDAAVLDEIEESQVPAVKSDMSTALAIGQVTGDLSQQDLIIPRLSIVQSVGPLSEHFPGGTLVLNQELVLSVAADKDNEQEPIKFTVLSINKVYEDWLDFDPQGPRPSVYQSIEDVQNAGKWIDWRDNERPPVRPVGNALVAIKQPEGIDSLAFSMEYKGSRYAVALWTMRSTAYARGAKRIFSASQLELKTTGLLAGEWSLHASRDNVGGNWIFVPVLRLTGRNDKNAIQFFTDSLS